MNKSKGCFNKNCIVFKEKRFLDVKTDCCPECGEKLYFVCKHEKCYKKISDNRKYCEAHKEMHKNKIQKIVGAVGSGAAVAAGLFITIVTRGRK